MDAMIPMLPDPAAGRAGVDQEVDDEGRLEPPVDADEWATLTGFLDFQRSTLHWKCSGLGAADLRVRVAASRVTLGGLLKHLAWVEDHWFTTMLQGREAPAWWRDVDWDADRDWEWTSAADDSPAELFGLWSESVARSRAAADEARAAGGLETLTARAWPDGTRMSLRWVLVHMIEEYARHNGHADLIREAIDGSTGE